MLWQDVVLSKMGLNNNLCPLIISVAVHILKCCDVDI